MPWSVDDVRYEPTRVGGVGILGPGGGLVAVVPPGPDDGEIAREITRRLNACDELLAACRVLVSDPSDEWSQTAFDRRVGAARRMAFAAIARLEGGA